jgi:protein-L-isoaspartate(D-aspartate) O-methyltransferase
MKRFDEERAEMLNLLRERGITDDRVLDAMAKVERHLFVPSAFTNRAYDDTALPIAKSQTISQPYTVAFMTQQLDPRPGSKVLEIGTGSGYQAAILATMGCRVFTIERHLELLLEARKRFEKLGLRIASKVGDGTLGWSEFAPYDSIIVTAAAPSVPEPLIKQLNAGGRLVIPVGDLDMQRLRVVTKNGEHFDVREVYGFKFVPLIGKEGWKGNDT